MPNDETLYFDKVKLLDGTVAYVYDAVARQAIAGGTHFIGVTTTSITDGDTTNPITIAEASVTAVNGDIVVNGNKEFIFSDVDDAWHELGDTTGLGALALKDSVTAVYTPAGTISKPSVNVTTSTEFVAEVSSIGSVIGGTVREMSSAGSVVAGTANTPTVVTLPTLTMTLNGTTLELSWTAGSVVSGVAGVPTTVNLPTFKETSVVTSATMPTFREVGVLASVSAELSAAPEFSGTQSTIVSE